MDPKLLQNMLEQQFQTNPDKLSNEEQEKLKKSFQNPEFLKMFGEFAKELDSEQGKKDIEQSIIKMEEMAKSKAFIQQQQESKMLQQREKPPQQKQNLSAHQKKLQHEREENAKKLEKKQLDAELKQKEELAKMKMFQDMMKKDQKPQQEQQSQIPSKQQLEAAATKNLDQTTSDFSPADYQKLEQFLKDADQLALGKKPQSEDDILEKFAPKNQQLPLHGEVIYVQDSEMGDFIQEEKLSIEKARGYKSIKIRILLPHNCNQESSKLDIGKNTIKFSISSPEKDYLYQKEFKMDLRQKSGTAKLKTLSSEDQQRTGCMQYIEVLVDIERSAENVNKMIQEVRQLKYVHELGAPQPVPTQENEIKVLKQKQEIQSQFDVEQFKEQSDKWGQQKVEIVDNGQINALTKAYKEGLEKKKKNFNVDKIEEGLQEMEKVGIEFMFRGKALGFCNQSLVDMLK